MIAEEKEIEIERKVKELEVLYKNLVKQMAIVYEYMEEKEKETFIPLTKAITEKKILISRRTIMRWLRTGKLKEDYHFKRVNIRRDIYINPKTINQIGKD